MSYNMMFTSGVWKTNKAFNLKEYCLSVQRKDEGRVVSNRGGYQSNELNLRDPKLRPLISHIEQQTNQYNREVWKCLDTFEVNGLWVNINDKGNSNISHIHPRCHFSGVYYVDKPKDSGNIIFSRPDGDLINIFFCDVKRNVSTSVNSEEWFFDCVNDDMIVFPAFYKHRVDVSRSSGQRISMSFNLTVKSK